MYVAKVVTVLHAMVVDISTIVLLERLLRLN